MSNNKFHSLRTKLIVYFCLLFLTVFIAAQVVALTGLPFSKFAGYLGHEKDEVFQKINAIADLKKERLERIVREMRHDVHVLSANKMMSDSVARLLATISRLKEEGLVPDELWKRVRSTDSHENLKDMLETIESTYDTYRDVYLVAAETGKIAVSASGEHIGADLGKDRCFTDALQSREAYVGDIEFDQRKHSNPVFHVSRVVGNPQNEDDVVAVLVAMVDAGEIIKPMLHAGEGLGESGEALLVSQDGTALTALMHPLPDGTRPEPLKHRITAEPATLAAQGREGVFESRDYRGEPVLAAYRHVRVGPEAGWGLVVKIDKQDLSSRMWQYASYSLVTGLVGILLVIAVTILLGRSITRPILALAQVARDVSEGRLDARAQVKTTDEVGRLAETFNDMVQHVQGWRTDLETQVQDRTADLALMTRQWEDTFNAIEDMVFIVDKDFRIVRANRAAVRSCKPDELIGRYCYKIIHGTQAPPESCPSRGVFQSGKAVRAEAREPHLGNRWFNFVVYPVTDDDGKILTNVHIVSDVTERKRAEEERTKLDEQVRHTQKLESLGILAGGIAHDFNNLLMGVLGNADVVMMKIAPESPIKPYIQNIHTAAQRLADLANQMLAYSGKGKFIVEPLNLSRLVEEMAHLLEISISKNIVIKYDFMPDLPDIEADASQIRQVVMNLITNAADAIGEKSGVISVCTGLMEVDNKYLSETYLFDVLPEGYYVLIEISDTGCGMDEETQEKIFEPFFTTKSAGRGLGLAAVMGIVRGHGGAIKVYSEPRRGTTFKILFPRADPSDRKELLDRAEPRPRLQGSGTVLVVDDEEVVRYTAKMMLQEIGFTVLLANDGRGALKVFGKHVDEIKVVLLDLTMPHMSGEETYSEMRRIKADISVILCSGFNKQDATGRLAGKSLAGFLKKPFKMIALEDELQKVLKS